MVEIENFFLQLSILAIKSNCIRYNILGIASDLNPKYEIPFCEVSFRGTTLFYFHICSFTMPPFTELNPHEVRERHALLLLVHFMMHSLLGSTWPLIWSFA